PMGAPRGQLPYQTAPQRFQPPPGQQVIPGSGRYSPTSMSPPMTRTAPPGAPPPSGQPVSPPGAGGFPSRPPFTPQGGGQGRMTIYNQPAGPPAPGGGGFSPTSMPGMGPPPFPGAPPGPPATPDQAPAHVGGAENAIPESMQEMRPPAPMQARPNSGWPNF